MRRFNRAIKALVITAVAAFMPACIGSDRVINPQFQGLEIAPGGKLTVGGAASIESLDPALTLSSSSAFLARGLYRTLVAFAPATEAGEEDSVTGDLALDTGKVNEDLTEWTFRLRDGVTFGLAVGGEEVEGVTGTEVTSTDLKYSIERLFNLAPHGAATYFARIKGADAYLAGESDDIAGIETPDDNTVVFRLTTPTGDWPYRMALPATAPVPEVYARSLDAPGGADYGDHVIATGPYYVERWIPGEKLHLKRNPLWEPSEDAVRAAFVDEVEWEFGFDQATADGAHTSDKIVGGRFDLVEGAGREEVLLGAGFDDNTVSAASMCTRYLWLNTEVEPFDDKNVRKAVALAIDRAALLDLQGGPSTGDVATSLLPPGLAGHLTEETYNPFDTPEMSGDVKAARKELKKAGLDDATLDEEILVVGSSEAPEDEYARSVKSDLKTLGFTNVKVKLVSPPGLFVDFYAKAKEKRVAVATSAARCREFLDPASFFEPLLAGASDTLKAFGMTSLLPNVGTDGDGSEADAGKRRLKAFEEPLRAALAKADATPPGPERVLAWEKVNMLVTESAVLIPWSWDRREIVYNGMRLMNPVYERSYAGLDWVVAGLRQE